MIPFQFNFDTPNHLLFVFSEQILWLDGTFCPTINNNKIALSFCQSDIWYGK